MAERALAPPPGTSLNAGKGSGIHVRRRGGRNLKVGVVLNPIAGGGRLKRHWPDVAAALKKHFGDFELRETQAEGDAERLALDLAANGFDLVIAAGGDGTASEVADGLLQAREEGGRTTELGLLPCGTGIDFARGLGLAEGDRRDAETDCRGEGQGGGCRPHLLYRRPWRAGQPPLHQHRQPWLVGRHRPGRQCR
nr:diacylglycerol kinase family protein [Mesorhizobium sp. LNHC220B00]